MAFAIETPAFPSGGQIPGRYAKTGSDETPPLRWRGAPAETQTLALIMEDPDAHGGTFTHWLVWDLAADSTQLEGWERGEFGITGRNDFGDIDYGGPKPPPGDGPHRYIIRIYALDLPTLGLDDGASRLDVDRAIRGHVLATAELMGRFRSAEPAVMPRHA